MPELIMENWMKAAFEQYEVEQEIAKEVLEEIHFNERWKEIAKDFPGYKKKNDIRDFDRMAGLFKAEGRTREEREADRKQKITQMEEAFLNPTLEARKPYLDILYDFRDNFDLSDINMEEIDDVLKLYVYGGLSQTFGVKRQENEEYYAHRYPTPESRRLADAKDRYALSVSQQVSRMISTAGLSYNSQSSLTLATAKPGEAGYEEMFYEYAEWDMKNVEAEIRGETPSRECRLVLSETMACFNEVDISNLHTIPKALREEAMRMESIITGNLHTYDTVERNLMSDIGVKPEDLIFIDGKSITELIEEKYPGNTDYDLHNCMLAAALADGKSRVEFVSLKPQADGGCEYVTKTIHADYRKTDPPESHSWLRRLFNWGPFKMRQDRQDSLFASDPGREERHRDMCAKAKVKVEAGMQANAEKKARRAREEMERKAEMAKEAAMAKDVAREKEVAMAKEAAMQSSKQNEREAALDGSAKRKAAATASTSVAGVEKKTQQMGMSK